MASIQMDTDTYSPSPRPRPMPLPSIREYTITIYDLLSRARAVRHSHSVHCIGLICTAVDL
jgi:hypothetical protein